MINLIKSLLNILEKILELIYPYIKADKQKIWKETIEAWKEKHKEHNNDIEKLKELEERIKNNDKDGISKPKV